MTCIVDKQIDTQTDADNILSTENFLSLFNFNLTVN